MDTEDKVTAVAAVVAAVLIVSFWLGVIYVVAHFIGKAW